MAEVMFESATSVMCARKPRTFCDSNYLKPITEDRVQIPTCKTRRGDYPPFSVASATTGGSPLVAAEQLADGFLRKSLQGK